MPSDDSPARVPLDNTAAMPGPLPPVPRTRALPDNPVLAERCVQLLQGLQAFMRLNAAEARSTLPYLREVLVPRGEVLMRSGDVSAASFVLLLLEGEVAVRMDSSQAANVDPQAVLGPGSVLGEISLFDGAPRSATCVALTAVQAAGLSRRGLEMLLAEQPTVAAKLMAAMARQMADRLRGLGDQLMIYAQLNDQLRDELIQLRLRLPR